MDECQLCYNQLPSTYASVSLTGGQFSTDLRCSGYGTTITLPGSMPFYVSDLVTFYAQRSNNYPLVDAVVRGLGIGETSTLFPQFGGSISKSVIIFLNTANGQGRQEPGAYSYLSDGAQAPRYFRSTPTNQVLYSSWGGDQSTITVRPPNTHNVPLFYYCAKDLRVCRSKQCCLLLRRSILS
jgi:hypothetical protein